MCLKKWMFIFVLFIVIQSMWAQPVKARPGNTIRKSCGRDLVERVDRICQSRGGHMTYTKARRVRRGIVNECCTNKCADHHIYAYCSNGKQDGQSGDSDSLLETPVLTGDLDVAESRVPALYALDMQNAIQPITESTVEKVTLEPDQRYHDYANSNVYVNSNVDSEYVNQLIKKLPRNSNDFQVGTVPPEYRISRYIPSRVRIISNY